MHAPGGTHPSAPKVVRYKLPIVVIVINNNGIGTMNPTEYSGA